MTRRVVRATPDFFLQLDDQLGDERGGPNGEPSAVDFAAYELIPIIERSSRPVGITWPSRSPVAPRTGWVAP